MNTKQLFDLINKVKQDKNYLISYLTKKNDLALKFNYFKKVKLEKNNSKNDNEKETQN